MGYVLRSSNHYLLWVRFFFGPRMPWTTDFTSVVGPRKDFGWLNYLNLFVTHQVRSGRYQELWGQFVGGDAPELRIPGVMY